MTNPLLTHSKLPPFTQIKIEDIESGIKEIISQNRKKIASLLENTKEVSWDSFMQPLDNIDEVLSDAFSPISHMNSVVNSEDLQKAYAACLPILSEYSTELGQNEILYKKIKTLADNDKGLSTAQKKVIQDSLLDFMLTGVSLPKDKKQQFANIKKELADLSHQYEQNLLDATNAWSKHITNENQIAGLPDVAKAQLQQAARAKNLEGYLLSLEIPCYLAVVMHADNRDLRQEMYTAYNTRASDQGPTAGQWNNDKVMQSILINRQKMAKLLEYNNYAEVSLVKKMANTPEEVFNFLNDLSQKARQKALIEYSELQAFALEDYQIEDLQAWDIAYFSEKLRQKKYDLSQEALRPYFPVDTVLNGMFDIINKIYGMTVKEMQGIETWHPDVKFFEVVDENNQLRGQFYIDLFARSSKRGGAWMDECRVRRKLDDGSINTPVAYLTCNFSAPVGDKPSLLTHDEVTTLFHEFGHTLHHILTLVDYSGVSGINGVPWDAVEFPSQFMENFCWQREALDMMSGHVDTGEKIPADLYEKMLNAKYFQAGMKLVRQLEFALFDMRLHSEFNPHETNQIQSILDEVRADVAVVIPPAFNRFQTGFSHIFAGGYAAGYFSYLWAEVLAQDAFGLFEERGVFDKVTGRSFLNNVLEKGGAEDPNVLFEVFRGRLPEADALLKSHGIIE